MADAGLNTDAGAC